MKFEFNVKLFHLVMPNGTKRKKIIEVNLPRAMTICPFNTVKMNTYSQEHCLFLEAD